MFFKRELLLLLHERILYEQEDRIGKRRGEDKREDRDRIGIGIGIGEDRRGQDIIG